jgi:hypothetical protein
MHNSEPSQLEHVSAALCISALQLTRTPALPSKHTRLELKFDLIVLRTRPSAFNPHPSALIGPRGEATRVFVTRINRGKKALFPPTSHRLRYYRISNCQLGLSNRIESYLGPHCAAP